MRRGFSQQELADATNRDRAQIARWERGVNDPSFNTLREVLQACGYDLSTELIEFNTSEDEGLRVSLRQTPQERLQALDQGRGGGS